MFTRLQRDLRSHRLEGSGRARKKLPDELALVVDCHVRVLRPPVLGCEEGGYRRPRIEAGRSRAVDAHRQPVVGGGQLHA